jgi:predicted short-subunit dehydrogenase-like oxidoreductase (DUF2520 family)
MTKARPKLGFIGAGRAGSALAMALAATGYDVVAIASRTAASATTLAAALPKAQAVDGPQTVVDSTDLVFITTPDVAIESAVSGLRWRPGIAVVHTSGVETRSLLQKAADAGAETGSLHPLQTFAGREQGAAKLHGSVFAVEAEGGLRQTLLDIVSALGGRAIELEAEDKALYHASAVFASNYVITLMQLASDVWLRFGWERQAAVMALLPLMQGAVKNIETLGLPRALTGPIARGDTSTVQRHIDALSEREMALVAPYSQLGLQTISMAQAQGGLSETAAAEIESILRAALPTPQPEDRGMGDPGAERK